MPIEFRCNQCGKMLRTPDDTAGRPARCPACGALSTVPGTVEGRPAASDVTPPPGGAPAAEDYSSPEAAPRVEVLPDELEHWASMRVSGPATALIVTAVLGMALNGLAVIANLNMMAMRAQPPKIFDDLPVHFHAGMHLAGGIFGLAMGALVLFGAYKMKNLESYALAMTAAVVALVPCTSPCCVLGLPFGIWALVVLGDAAVHAAFRS